MASDTVQQVKDRLSIVDVVSQYVKLERAGSTLRARCPFHAEKTPSFFVSAERGTFHCFGCGEGGDIFTFVEKIEGLDFKGALKVLADKAGVEIVYERGGKEKKDERERLFELMETVTIYFSSKLPDDAKKYLRERGLTDATIKEFRLGFAGSGWTDASDFLKQKGFTEKEIIDAGVGKKGDRSILDKFRNRIMFPINDLAGRPIAFSGRIFGDMASPDAPKYLNSPETPLFRKSNVLYGLDKAKLAIRKLNCVLLVEGQMDLLAVHQAGWRNAVAVSGTAFTDEHAKLVKRFNDNILISLDIDEAGIKAALRTANVAFAHEMNVKVVQLPDELDPADFILKEGKDRWAASIRNSKDVVTFLLDVLDQRLNSRDKFLRTVESVILPLVKKERRAMRKENYVRDIATRLRITEGAVTEQMENIPNEPLRISVHEQITVEAKPKLVIAEENKKRLPEKSLQAFALLLWQQSLAEPVIDVQSFEKQLQNALGKDLFKELSALSESEKEALRFLGADKYEHSRSLNEDLDVLVRQVQSPKRYLETYEMLSKLERDDGVT